MPALVESWMEGSLPEAVDPRVRGLYDYWQSIRPAPGLLPGRQHFDPVDIPRLLPWIWLADVLTDPMRFRYRLVGTEHAERMGNHTGKLFEDVYRNFVGSHHRAQFVTAATEGVEVYRCGRPSFLRDQDYLWVERMILPLAKDGRTVDILIGMTIHHRQMGDSDRT